MQNTVELFPYIRKQCTYFVIGITQPVIGVTFKQLQLHQ